MGKKFTLEKDAREYYNPGLADHEDPDVYVEECEICGEWSASVADHADGDIQAGNCDPETGERKYERVCSDCLEEDSNRMDAVRIVKDQTVTHIVNHLRDVVAQYREVYDHKDADCDCACCKALALLKALDEVKVIKVWAGVYHTRDGEHWMYTAPTETDLYRVLFDEVIEDDWDQESHGDIPKDRKKAVEQYIAAEVEAGELVYFDCEEVEMKL